MSRQAVQDRWTSGPISLFVVFVVDRLRKSTTIHRLPAIIFFFFSTRFSFRSSRLWPTVLREIATWTEPIEPSWSTGTNTIHLCTRSHFGFSKRFLDFVHLFLSTARRLFGIIFYSSSSSFNHFNFDSAYINPSWYWVIVLTHQIWYRYAIILWLVKLSENLTRPLPCLSFNILDFQ